MVGLQAHGHVARGDAARELASGLRGVEAEAAGLGARDLARAEAPLRCRGGFSREAAELELQAHALLRQRKVEERGAHREALLAPLLGAVGAGGRKELRGLRLAKLRLAAALDQLLDAHRAVEGLVAQGPRSDPRL